MFLKVILNLIFIFFLMNCSHEAIYSGKIINQDDFNNVNFKNKDSLVKKLGLPSYIDPIEKKYFYYYEKKQRNFSYNNNKNEYSYIFVFRFNEEDLIIDTQSYNLKNKNEVKLIKNETPNNIIKRGLLEKIFGGVGTQQELPTTP